MSFGAQNRAKSAPYTLDFDVESWKSTDLKEKKAAFWDKHSDVSDNFRAGCCEQILFVLLHMLCSGAHAGSAVVHTQLICRSRTKPSVGLSVVRFCLSFSWVGRVRSWILAKAALKERRRKRSNPKGTDFCRSTCAVIWRKSAVFIARHTPEHSNSLISYSARKKESRPRRTRQFGQWLCMSGRSPATKKARKFLQNWTKRESFARRVTTNMTRNCGAGNPLLGKISSSRRVQRGAVGRSMSPHIYSNQKILTEKLIKTLVIYRSLYAGPVCVFFTHLHFFANFRDVRFLRIFAGALWSCMIGKWSFLLWNTFVVLIVSFMIGKWLLFSSNMSVVLMLSCMIGKW